MLQDSPVFRSLCQERRYELTSVDSSEHKLSIRYESSRLRPIKIAHLVAFLRELYRVGRLPRNYFRNQSNCRRIFGWSTWHAPGAAMYAILPVLDHDVEKDSECGLVVHPVPGAP
jgi:hypothetical protein